MKKIIKCICILSSLVLLLCGCSQKEKNDDLLYMNTKTDKESNFAEEVQSQSENHMESAVYYPIAKGEIVYGGNSESNMVTIDASNTNMGYIMVKCENGVEAKKKVIIEGPSGLKYTYDLNTEGKYETFILSDGEGQYTVSVYENIEGSKYITLFSQQMQVSLLNPFIPFLNPNQYVDYTMGSEVVKLAEELTKEASQDLEKVQLVYQYVVENISYDTQKAKTVQSGYLPDVDEILQQKKGICFDYAAVMTAMLRSRNIPTKLVTGFTGSNYHAWISTYTEETGWIEGVIFFDGISWKLMDPTFAANTTSENQGRKDVVNSKDYLEKYVY